MALTSGTRIGVYEIKSPLGEGGMGVVYRARDSKLNRDVALKLLPDHFADNPERLSWFQREAQVLAALNHPNIAQIYGLEEFGEAGASRCIVMELVEGETLAERLKRGPISVDQALPIAAQIATALEAAHEKGIIHRDLKPANIKLTPEGNVKVLDFGLAKAFEDTSRPDSSNSPTLSIAATNAGVIIGTAGYMSPEQASGKPADKRSDIWSYGVVLFEMLTGARLFESGETLSHTLADVLRAPIDLARLPADTPRSMRNLIARCLDRNVKNRLRDIGEARIAIENSTSTPEVAVAAQPRRSGSMLWLAATVIVTILAIVAGWGWWRASKTIERALMRLTNDLGDILYLNTSAGPSIAISPDGLRLAYLSIGSDGERHLSVRLLRDSKSTLLSGADDSGPLAPFFSPDGHWIGFFAGDKLKKISVEGGAAVTLCSVGSTNPRGGFWGEDGNILFAAQTTPLMRVSAAGGTPVPATQLDQAKHEVSNRFAQLLPGGEAFLFSASTDNNVWETATIEVQEIKTGKRKTLVSGGYFGRYISNSNGDGYLLYVHEGTVFAVPLDLKRLELTGTASPVLEDVSGRAQNGFPHLALTRDGAIVYVAGSNAHVQQSLGFLDAMDNVQTLPAPADEYVGPVRPSPKGDLIAVRSVNSEGQSLSVYEPQTNRMTRLLRVKGFFPNYTTWTPDGKHIVFMLAGNDLAGPGLYWMRADGAGEPQRLLEGRYMEPYSFSPDSKRLAYSWTLGADEYGISTLPLDLSDPERPKPGKPEVFLTSKTALFSPAFSPDGKWMAYMSAETRPEEIFVRPFVADSPASGGKWLISSKGGLLPMWSGSGNEIVYFKPTDRKSYTVTYTVRDNSFSPDQPKLWSKAGKSVLLAGPPYLMPDGKRFVVILPPSDGSSERQSHITFLLNFADELRRRLQPGK